MGTDFISADNFDLSKFTLTVLTKTSDELKVPDRSSLDETHRGFLQGYTQITNRWKKQKEINTQVNR